MKIKAKPMSHSARILLVLAIVPSLQAATLSYSNNFDSETTGNAAPSMPQSGTGTFAELVDSNWSAATGGLTGAGSATDKVYLANSSSTSSSTQISTLNFSPPIAGNNFTQSVDFNLTTFTAGGTGSGNGNTTRVGFGVLGASANFSTSYYLADFVVAGNVSSPAAGSRVGDIRLLEISGDGQINSTSSAQSNLAVNGTDNYRMTLVGIYSGGGLTLNYSVTNLTTSASVSVNGIDSSPLTGANLGFRNSIGTIGGATGALDVNFDNFSIVPEPSSAVLLGLGGVLLIVRRRRAA